MTDLPTCVFERLFAAPRTLVWTAWTDPALFARWYGPNVETVIHALDLKAGGACRLEMRWAGGSGRQLLSYVEVTPPERLVWLHSETDADWKVAANPRMPDWPRTLLTTVTFAEEGEGTRLRLEWAPHDATAAEIACFAAAMDGMGRGWNAGMDILERMLAEMQGQAS